MKYKNKEYCLPAILLLLQAWSNKSSSSETKKYFSARIKTYLRLKIEKIM